VAIFGLIGMLAGCQVPTGRRVCIDIHASDELNLYDGEAHAVELRLYPLGERRSFEQLSADELLDGAKPDSLTGHIYTTMVVPGEYRKLRERFPLNTMFVGVLVGYYRGSHEHAGVRTTTTRARCGWFSVPEIVLGPRDLPKN
jgi:type VI secretion system VasD/TssJ family lipoprotein